MDNVLTLWPFPLPWHLLDPPILQKHVGLKNFEFFASLLILTEMGFLFHAYIHVH